jgi:hypothetical protein
LFLTLKPLRYRYSQDATKVIEQCWRQCGLSGNMFVMLLLSHTNEGGCTKITLLAVVTGSNPFSNF